MIMKNFYSTLMKDPLWNLSLVIIPSVITYCTTNFFNKRKNYNSIPKLQTYMLDMNKNNEEYRHEIFTHKWYYLLKEDSSITHNPDIGISVKHTVALSKITKEQCEDFILKHNSYAMCFSNHTANSTLNINYLTTNRGDQKCIADDTILSALTTSGGACVICDINNIPKSFKGSFRKNSVKYSLRPTTEHVQPKCYKLKKKRYRKEVIQ